MNHAAQEPKQPSMEYITQHAASPPEPGPLLVASPECTNFSKAATNYSPTQRVIIESDFKPLGRAEAAKMGVVLTESQAVALAFVLTCSTAALENVVRGFCADLPAPEYNLEFEHPTHTWGRWAAALDNDETPPCQRYTDYVADQLAQEAEAQELRESLSSGEHEPGDAVPFTDEELADLDDDDDNLNPPNELAFEHLN